MLIEFVTTLVDLLWNAAGIGASVFLIFLGLKTAARFIAHSFKG